VMLSVVACADDLSVSIERLLSAPRYGRDILNSLLSGYNVNRFNWLAKSPKSSMESDG